VYHKGIFRVEEILHQGEEVPSSTRCVLQEAVNHELQIHNQQVLPSYETPSESIGQRVLSTGIAETSELKHPTNQN
jgi:hypothetical protein